MALYVLTNKECYLLFPADTSPAKPFYYTSHTGAGVAWYTYPDSLYIAAHLGILFNSKATLVQTTGAPPTPLCGVSPGGGVIFPHLTKPNFIQAFLEWLDQQPIIGGWKIGEKIETAIDWVLDRINDLLDLGESIANKALEAWETLRTIWSDISDFVRGALAPLWNEVRDFADRLDSLWDALTDRVNDVIGDITQWVSSELTYFGNLLSRLREDFDEFWRYTLPGLIDRITLSDILGVALLPVLGTLNRLTDLVDSFRDFFDDPEKWLLDKIESMLARFI